MKKGLTEMVFILDKSGSMSGHERDTIGGFNSMIEAQKRVDGEAFVSTVLFSDRSKVLHDRKNLQDVLPLTEKEYYVGGNTALIDAIGDAIHHIQNVHKYAREEDIPEKTVFVIMTDGYENASRRWSSDNVKRIIAEQEKKGWEFIYLGANIDAVETGRSFGMRSDRCVDYDIEDARAMSMFTSDRISDLREGKDLGRTVRVYSKNLTDAALERMKMRSLELEEDAFERAKNSAPSGKGQRQED